ncbi:hypothetical protein [Pseudoalteromonas gelatinilytica]|uniref:Uncharacterized protein n=1 Tax=Pseudoalteromonas gelatinilytica TaxID=1703256 RepID=A0ABQ1TDH5_9GAMM|nr:hypothetical protein [Pseudoalteromonas profundi]GGE91310.1 hypothetical protein GCM10008027_15190 [Pseudoalteromonas profundi]
MTVVWRKNNLPTGDLQLLSQGHSSGVLRLTQAGYTVNGSSIDQTEYFRNFVFSQLAWRSIDGKEMASAQFNLRIEGQELGIFNLEISHKPSWESGQNNYTTGLHWGTATKHIQRNDLVGKSLTLSKISGDHFIIDIT